MSWILVALSAYLILAIVNLFDKFLVDNVIKSSRAYAFAACGLGALVIVAAPWFLEWPGWALFFHNIINGAIFAAALWSLYAALRKGEASRVLVFVGGMTPVFSIIISTLFFNEHFSSGEWLGIGLILTGIFLIAFLPASRSYLARILNRFRFTPSVSSGGLFIALLSAFAYSIYFISTKEAYISQSFLSAFLWTRIGAALSVLLFLARRDDRRAIAKLFTGQGHKKSGLLVVFNQALGAAGFILQNYAVFLGSVVIVNALQGAQYAFLLIISAGLALWKPKLLKETFSWRILTQKSLAVAVIVIGLYLLTGR